MAQTWHWHQASAAIASLGLAGSCLTAISSSAQIAPDQTLGSESSIVAPNATVRGFPAELIQGGATRGVNLFHSFSQFNVRDGQRVYFANPVGIETILSRVTGADPSRIFGTLGVNGRANLFLINPNGILFGPSARLDVAGSFLASTASSFKFPDGSEFSATTPQAAPLLTVNVPLGLQYGRAIGDINHAGNLSVSPGQRLTLHGNIVTSTGTLAAPGGEVQVLGDRIALLAPTQIDVSSPTGGGTVLIGGDFQGKGSLPTASETLIGANVVIRADATEIGDGGKVVIWAEDATRFLGTISAKGGTQAGNGGFVEVSGKQNLLFNGTVDLSAAKGQLGTLLLDPTDIVIVNGAGAANDGALPVIQASDGGATSFFISEAALEALPGNANVILQATNNITINDLADNQLTFAPGTGSIAFQADADNSSAGSFLMNLADTIRADGRNVAISGAEIRVGGIFTPAFNAGSIRLEALGNINAAGFGSGPVGAGTGGDVTVISRTGGITLTGIDTGSAGVGLGNGGNIFLSARGDIISSGLLTRSNVFGSAGTVTVSSSEGNILIQSGRFGIHTFGFVGGAIALSAPNGGITVNNILTFGSFDAGGAISFTAGRDIAVTEQINSFGRGRGSGGNIAFTSTGGAIALTGTVNTVAISGNGGAIALTAAGNITTTQVIDSGSFGASRGGDIIFTSTGGSITTQETLRTDSFRGGAGQIQLAAAGNITTNILNAATFGNDNGGNIAINSGATFASTNSLILSGTGGSGRAGNINIQATTIALTDSVINSGTAGSGTAGDIILRGNSINLSNGSAIVAGSIGTGQGGNLTAIANDTFSLSGISATGLFSQAGTNTFGIGDAGNVAIAAGRLILRDGAVISSTTGDFTTPGAPAGQGGSLTVNADLVDIRGASSDGRSPSRLATSSFSPSKAGDLIVNARQILLQDGGILATSSFDRGRGGNLTVNASSSLTVDGYIDTVQGRFPSGVSADTFGGGLAGDLTINTRQLTVQNGAAVSVSTFGRGQGGNLTVNASSAVLLQGVDPDGFRSGLYAQAFDQGGAGNLTVRSQDIQVRDKATITVASGSAADGKLATGTLKNVTGFTIGTRPATGTAGTLTLDSTRLTLDNQGQLLASTDFGQGGNINLTVRDLVLLRRNSSISATAGTAQSGGDGGNITINIPDGFIVAVRTENSDITANAFTGNGGQVNITAYGIFGIEPRPKLTPLSDITASSQFGLSGTVLLTTPNVDPTRGLVAFPINLADPARQIAQSCVPQGVARANSFTITGRGGIPSSPDEPLQSQEGLADWVVVRDGSSSVMQNGKTDSTVIAATQSNPLLPMTALVEAQGWVQSADGTIALVAYTPKAVLTNSWLRSPDCGEKKGEKSSWNDFACFSFKDLRVNTVLTRRVSTTLNPRLLKVKCLALSLPKEVET